MKTDNVLYWIIYFVVTVIIAWIALSLILIWFRPVLYNANGSVNWWTTLWVAALVILFAWLIMVILTFLISLFTGGWGGCYRAPECQKVVKECDPCDRNGYNGQVAQVAQVAPGFEPRMWMY